MNKPQIIAEIRRKMLETTDDPSHSWDRSDLQRGCLYWAYHTVGTVRAHGHRAIIQAGTCLWPRLRVDQDDGLASTHFGYQWAPEEAASKLAIALGNLPELHVWAAIPGANEIIDLTTGYFVAQCRVTIHEDWPGDQPPDYFWGPASSLPSRVAYRPNMHATAAALNCITRKFGVTKQQVLAQCIN